MFSALKIIWKWIKTADLLETVLDWAKKIVLFVLPVLGAFVAWVRGFDPLIIFIIALDIFVFLYGLFAFTQLYVIANKNADKRTKLEKVISFIDNHISEGQEILNYTGTFQIENEINFWQSTILSYLKVNVKADTLDHFKLMSMQADIYKKLDRPSDKINRYTIALKQLRNKLTAEDIKA